MYLCNLSPLFPIFPYSHLAYNADVNKLNRIKLNVLFIERTSIISSIFYVFHVQKFSDFESDESILLG